MKYQLHIKVDLDSWQPLKNECFDYLGISIRQARELIKNTESTMIVVVRNGDHLIKFISHLKYPYFIHPDYKSEVLAALGETPLTFADVIKIDKVTIDKCPDCHGVGFYIPFVGPKESCQTCSSNV